MNKPADDPAPTCKKSLPVAEEVPSTNNYLKDVTLDEIQDYLVKKKQFDIAYAICELRERLAEHQRKIDDAKTSIKKALTTGDIANVKYYLREALKELGDK